MEAATLKPNIFSNRKIQVSAPGKVILYGEHSVVYGKLAIAASLGLRTHLNFSEIDDEDVLEIEFVSFDFKTRFSLKQVTGLYQNTPNFNYTDPTTSDFEGQVLKITKFIESHKCSKDQKIKHGLIALFYLLTTLKPSLHSSRIQISTKLTISAGTGSSASFSVCISAMLLALIRNELDFKLSNSNLHLVSKWAFEAERILHGTPSGVDNTICTFGAFVSFRRGEAPDLFNVSPAYNYRLILIDTKVPRDTKQLVGGVRLLYDRFPKVINPILASLDRIAEEALVGLKMGDFEMLADLSAINHNLLNSIGVGHQRLDEAIHILRMYELRGKLTGAGGGGFAICLLYEYAEDKLNELLKDLNLAGFNCLITDLGGDGVTIDCSS